MSALLRFLAAALLVSWLTSPTRGGEGGENAGGTGVWILPRCTALAPSPGMGGQTGAPQCTYTMSSLNAGLSLVASIECGTVVATLIDPGSGTPMALPASGRSALLSRTTIDGLRVAGVVSANIVMMDAARQGYVIYATFDYAANTATLAVY